MEYKELLESITLADVENIQLDLPPGRGRFLHLPPEDIDKSWTIGFVLKSAIKFYGSPAEVRGYLDCL